MREITNHPVHVFDKNGDLSPSAFIPLCSFGGILEASETNFDVGFPVCNSFKPVLHYDQICYEVNLNNKFKKNEDLLRYLRVGIILTLDYNEDRQIKMNGESARIHFDTLSKNFFIAIKKINFLSLDPLELPAVGQKEEYGDIYIKVFRENTVTSSFLTLDKNTRKGPKHSFDLLGPACLYLTNFWL